MPWPPRKTGTRARKNADGTNLYAPGVARMTDDDIRTFIRGMVESCNPTRGEAVLLAQLRGEQVSTRRESEKDIMLLESGARGRQMLAAVIQDGSLPGWEPDEVGWTLLGRKMTQTEKAYEVVAEAVDVGTFGLVDVGDEGGVDDTAVQIWNTITG